MQLVSLIFVILLSVGLLSVGLSLYGTIFSHHNSLIMSKLPPPPHITCLLSSSYERSLKLFINKIHQPYQGHALVWLYCCVI